MTTASGTIIIGGGVIGMAIAWRLRARGVDVVVIDAAAPPATRAAAGMLAPSFEKTTGPLAQDLYEACAASLDLWREFAPMLEKDAGAFIDYRSEGILGAAFTQNGVDALHEDYGVLKNLGAHVEWLDTNNARQAEPTLSSDVRGAMLAMNDAQVDPAATLDALHAVFLKNGGRLKTSTPAVSILTEGGRVAGVRLADQSEIFSPHVVLAAGVQAAALSPHFSVNAAREPVLYPVKGEALAVRDENLPLQRTVRGEGAYLCPKSDGRIVIGASEAPHDDTLAPDPGAIEALQKAAARIAPAVFKCEEIARWAGLRPATRDHAPILGPDPDIEGLYYALGHFRNGVLLAPLTAQLLAVQIGDGACGSPIMQGFSIDRFCGSPADA